MGYRKLYYISALILLLTAFFSEGFNAWDEHFQIIEFAALKLGLTQASNLPWEFHYQMRPGFQPFLFYLVYSFFKFFSITDPFVIAFASRLITAVISFISISLLIKVYEKSFSGEKMMKAFVLLSFFLWFSVYNSVRFSSDTLSGRVFIIGLAWFLLKKEEGILKYLITGFLLGFSFIIRYQVAFMIIGFAAWILFIRKAGFRNFAVFTLGVLLVSGLGVLTDRWLYGEWTLTTWNYFHQNILLDKVSGFGINPWWHYLWDTFVTSIPPFSLVYIFGVILFFIFKPKDIVTWTILPFLLAHFLISHKEIRFLFPIIGFLPLMIITSADIILKKRPDNTMERKWVKIAIKLFWVTNLVMLVILIFRPADAQISLYRKIWYHYPDVTTLYYMDDNPYHRVKDIHYYRRNSLDIEKIDTITGIRKPGKRNILFVTGHPETISQFPGQSKLIYASFPQWLRKFNINHWIERTNFWYVYEIGK